MQRGPENGSAQAAGKRGAAKQTGRDALKNPNRSHASEAEEDERIRQVEDSDHECAVEKRACVCSSGYGGVYRVKLRMEATAATKI